MPVVTSPVAFWANADKTLAHKLAKARRTQKHEMTDFIDTLLQMSTAIPHDPLAFLSKETRSSRRIRPRQPCKIESIDTQFPPDKLKVRRPDPCPENARW